MTTSIEWTDETWNPVTGCTKVSPGCDHCYAERITNRFGGPGAFDTVVLHPERLEIPLRWRKPRRIFTCSMADLFHDDVPDEFIARVWAVMAMAGTHTFQVLTKRPGRMASLLRRREFIVAVQKAGLDILGPPWSWHVPSIEGEPVNWPTRNVWLGTSVESQKWADVRIPKLLETPAALRFLSCEPLLGPIDLGFLEPCDHIRQSHADIGCWNALDWVIVGGESGPNARPMHPDWARSLRDQCVAAGVPFFFKQWGEWTPNGAVGEGLWNLATGEQLLDVPMRRAGKKRGRKFDGRTWDEMP